MPIQDAALVRDPSFQICSGVFLFIHAVFDHSNLLIDTCCMLSTVLQNQSYLFFKVLGLSQTTLQGEQSVQQISDRLAPSWLPPKPEVNNTDYFHVLKAPHHDLPSLKNFA